ISICWGSFFITALVCHGELAADRPPPQFLTEFYLWMSVGGMVGGTFNGLIAPLIPWWGLFEFPLAIVFAGIVRPYFKGQNWTDKLLGAYESPNGKSISLALDFTLPLLILALGYFLISNSLNPEAWGWNAAGLIDPSGSTGQRFDAIIRRDSNNPLFRFAYKQIGLSGGLSYMFAKSMFIVLTYGICIGCALLAWKRPIRMGLGLGAVLLAAGLYENKSEDRSVLYRDRSYFGLLRVMEEKRFSGQKDEER